MKPNRIRAISAGMAAALLLGLLAGCAGGVEQQFGDGAATQTGDIVASEIQFVDKVELPDADIEDESVALLNGPIAIPEGMAPSAPGIRTKKNDRATVDYSNAADGYVIACYTRNTDKRLKCRVAGPSGTVYTYDVKVAEQAALPLSDGNGNYTVTVYEQISGNKYSTVLTADFQVSLNNEFAPFLRPNQYVNYTQAYSTVAKAQELIGNERDVLKKVEKVYDYITQNISYDNYLAMTVTSGYLPDLDAVLASGKGICFDYAALMAAMLRSQEVPTKLVVGYAGSAYHAWISVYSDETGWVENAIYFDGSAWQRMDPTFASAGNNSKEILDFINNSANYQAKYMY